MCVRTVACKAEAASEDVKGRDSESVSVSRVFRFGVLGE